MAYKFIYLLRMFYITHENLPPQTEVHYGMGYYMNCIW